MEPAPELATFFERFLRAFASDDVDAVLAAFSRAPGITAIGTAPDEIWRGYDVVAAYFRVQLDELSAIGPVAFAFSNIEAWREGSVGWIAAIATMSVGPDVSAAMRVTAVVRDEGPYPRIVQFHASVPVANESIVGTSLTTNIDDLLFDVQGEPLPSSASASDGSVSIVFTDIEGSTALMESLGESRWLELLAWHNDVLRAQTSIFGGTVVKSQGDGFMLAFAAPGSAVACAQAIQHALAPGWSGTAIPVRIGVHAGNARSEAGDFFGRTVVVAARVASSAAGGEILVTSAVRDGLGGAFTLEGPRLLSLKGLADALVAFSVPGRARIEP